MCHVNSTVIHLTRGKDSFRRVFSKFEYLSHTHSNIFQFENYEIFQTCDFSRLISLIKTSAKPERP